LIELRDSIAGASAPVIIVRNFQNSNDVNPAYSHVFAYSSKQPG
jgi:hypothetical protein